MKASDPMSLGLNQIHNILSSILKQRQALLNHFSLFCIDIILLARFIHYAVLHPLHLYWSVLAFSRPLRATDTAGLSLWTCPLWTFHNTLICLFFILVLLAACTRLGTLSCALMVRCLLNVLGRSFAIFSQGS